jgi:hypothetical protein
MMAGGYPVDATLTGADASRIDLMGSDLVFNHAGMGPHATT